MPPVSETKAVRKYLSTHAEEEARTLDLPAGRFDHVVVIPARGEGEGLDRAIAAVPGSPGGVLVLLVLNAAETDAPERHAANEAVRARYGIRNQTQFVELDRGRRLLAVDRAAPGRFLPRKQGVGLARKIGCDMALRLRTEERIRSRFLHTTDADAVLPVDVFERTGSFQNAADEDAPVALLFPFAHDPVPDPVLARAVVMYETALRYHRLGLHAAGSPYAFHTVGSTLAVDHRAYAVVRGFPRKEAGEDFYLLDKLAKSGPVRTLSGAPIRISGRVSDRVPFGTGRALLEFQRGDRTFDNYRLLDPRGFRALEVVLDWLDDLGARDAGTDLRGRARGRWKESGLDAESVSDVLESMGAFEAVAAFLDPALDKVRRRSIHTWFDAFRTLRFLHALRDRALPPVPFDAALDGAPFLGPHDERRRDPGTALALLVSLEETRCAGGSAWVGGPRPGRALSRGLA